MPGAGERFGVAQAGFVGHGGDDAAQVLQVVDAGSAGGVRGAHLEEDVDEDGRLEVVAVEPLLEDVEDGQQLVLGVVGAVARFALDPAVRPDVLAALEEGKDEVIFGWEVPVERGLGHARGLDDLVDPDRTDPAAGEQLVGRREDAFVCVGRRRL